MSAQEMIVISGWGLICPLGDTASQTFCALIAGKTIADRAEGLPSDIDPVDLVQALGTVGVARHAFGDPTVELAQRAAHEALGMARCDAGQVDCVVGVSKGAVHALVLAIQNARVIGPTRSGASSPLGGPPIGPVTDGPLAIALGPHGYLSYHLQKRLGIKPPLQTVAACASSLTALHQARTAMLATDPVDRPRRMLVITAEAALLPLFIHSYRRLGVLGTLSPARYRGRPLDRRRTGFMLAQMGAAIVLETVKRPGPGQIELVDTAVACDAYDLVRSAPGMPALGFVANRLCAGRRIDLLHPHATGTVDHDEAELTALAPCLDGCGDVYACKGGLGHGLGAAGLVALVLACMCAKAGRRPPMPWLDDPVDASQIGLRIARDGVRRRLDSHAVFSAGFAGHVAGAVIKRH